jgi:hypothetical protein
MPKCTNGHESQLALKCTKCGAAVAFRDSLSDLLVVREPELKFEEVGAVFIGVPPFASPGVYASEILLGRGKPTSRKFMAEKIEGGTWLDYNARYGEAFKAWLRMLEFGQSRYRVLITDTTNPLSVLAVNNLTPAANTVVFATVPGAKATPIAQNTSYAALQVARRRGMRLVLVSDVFVEQLTTFVEGKGLATGRKAFEQVVSFLLSFVSDVSDLIQKDAKLGVGAHYFSVLLSASDRVFRSPDDALAVQLPRTSLGAEREKAMTMHLLASATADVQREIEPAFNRLSAKEGQSLMDAESRFREKQTSHGLYDLFLLYGVKDPTIMEQLRAGYQTIASTAPDMSLEGGLSQAPSVTVPREEDGEAEAEEERSGPKQLLLMEDFVQARGEIVSLFLQLRGDLRETLIKFAAEIPPDKEPLEGLVGMYRDWLNGAYDEFFSSLAEQEGLPKESIGKLCAVAYCISTVQDSIFNADTDSKKRALAVLQEMGMGRESIEGLSLMATTETLLKGADSLIKKESAVKGSP